MSDSKHRSKTSWLLVAGGLAAALAVPPSHASPVPPHPVDDLLAVRNSAAFHLVDFVGWNSRNWDVMRHLHTADVKVDLGGQHTEGIDAHIAVMMQIIDGAPDTRLVEHTSIVASGDWTCMVGVSTEGSRIATVARWRDGAIAEEYLFFGAQPAGTPRPVLGGRPLVHIANPPGTRALYDVIGAEPGWSCLVDRAPDGRRVTIFTKRQAGAIVDEQIFTEF